MTGGSPTAAQTRLGVLGWPVRHSLSPAMHNAALRARGLLDWHYGLLPVPPDRFEETVRALAGLGYVGANVTIPYKGAALALADTASEAARGMGAANTLLLHRDGHIHAENTDAPGLLDALTSRGVRPEGASVQVLGAGGTARSAVWALTRAGARVAVWNRTPERARALCAQFGARAVSEPESADVLIQASAAGLAGSGELPALARLAPNADGLGRFRVVVDFVYGADPGTLLVGARSQGAETVDGLELLLRQGARAFTWFTGQAAPVDTMAATLGITAPEPVPSGR